MSSLLAVQAESNSRSQLYQLLAEPFRFPNEKRAQGFHSGTWQLKINQCMQSLEYSLPEMDLPEMNQTAKEYEVEFIAMYEVGMGGAPCPLHSGHYVRDRMKTMEEVLRFNRFFDYQPDRSADLFPDHITFELEFMQHMAGLYEDALINNGDVQSFLLAQWDFVSRNLLSWLPELSQRLEQQAQTEFFKCIGRSVNLIVQQDSLFLEQFVSQSESIDDGGMPNE